jgi:hypothetical protein
MKPIFYLLTSTILFTACASSKKHVAQHADETAFFGAVKKLNKKAGNAEAAKALPDLYARLQKNYLDSIEMYRNRNEVDRWNSVLANYLALQDLYESINGSAATRKLVQAVNYQKNISNSKEEAADEYYRLGMELLATGKRVEAAKASRFFKSALAFVPGYKDAAAQMDIAFKNSMVLIVISSIKADPHIGRGLSNDYIQELVSELGVKPNTANQVYFYTRKEADASNIKPDWVINVGVSKLDMEAPSSSQGSRYNSVQVVESYDTLRNPIYTNVSATITTHAQAVTGDVVLFVQIVENASMVSIADRKINYAYKWQNEYATYTGDARALSSQESMMAGSNYRPIPDQTEVLSEAISKVKPAIKQFIIATLNKHFGR